MFQKNQFARTIYPPIEHTLYNYVSFYNENRIYLYLTNPPFADTNNLYRIKIYKFEILTNTLI